MAAKGWIKYSTERHKVTHVKHIVSSRNVIQITDNVLVCREWADLINLLVFAKLSGNCLADLAYNAESASESKPHVLSFRFRILLLLWCCLLSLICVLVLQSDRSLINLHLLHTSYFLFVMTITMLIYAIVRGRPTKMKMSHASVRIVENWCVSIVSWSCCCWQRCVDLSRWAPDDS